MNPEILNIPVSDGNRLFSRLWEAHCAEAIIICVHGITEHSGRYIALAELITSRGFHFLAFDQRGHGKSVSDNLRGHLQLGEWQRMQQDLAEVIQFAQTKWKGLPCVIFAHSMGTLVSMNAVQRGLIHPMALILEGFPAYRPQLLFLGRVLLRTALFLFGKEGKNFCQAGLIYAFCGRFFRSEKGLFNWLSSQPDEVKNYTEDPLCRITITWGLSREILTGLCNVYNKNNLKKIPKEIPIFIAIGEKDPIAGFDEGIMRSLNRLRHYWRHPEWKIYNEGRHELHNDVHREVFLKDMCEFIKENIR
jgi:alpha-beta hydrolase superfamily lysophospholipase